MHMKLVWGLLIGSLVMLLTACGSSPKVDDSDEFGLDEYSDEYTDDFDTGADNKIRHAIGNPAVKDLWEEAEMARLQGDFDAAVVKLERALQIESQDAVIWSRLAEVRLQQGDSAQAENLAAKSNAMSIDNPLLNYRNWLIISHARKLRGDDIGSQEAEYTANSFRP